MREAERLELERDAQRFARTSENLHRRGIPVILETFEDNPFRGKYALDADGMRIFREKIAKGEIPIGPKPMHNGSIIDRRDNSDPQTIGMEILAQRNGRVPQ